MKFCLILFLSLFVKCFDVDALSTENDAIIRRMEMLEQRITEVETDNAELRAEKQLTGIS